MASPPDTVASPQLRARAQQTLFALMLGIALMLVLYWGVSAVQAARQQTTERLQGALDLASWGWSEYRNGLLRSAAAASQMVAVRELLATEQLVQERVLDAQHALSVISNTLPGASVAIYSAQGGTLAHIGTPAVQTDRVREWLATVLLEPAWRGIAVPGQSSQIAIAQPVRGVTRNAQSVRLGYIVITDDAQRLQTLSQDLWRSQQVALSVSINGVNVVVADEEPALQDSAQLTRTLDPLVTLRLATAQNRWPNAHRSLNWLLVALAILAVTGAALSATLERILFRPLEQLTRAVRAAVQGQPAAAITHSKHTELAELEHEFSRLIEGIRDSAKRTNELTFRDSLTGLPNRLLFWQSLEQATAMALRYQYKCALLFVDLDDFKRVNDSLGHQAGDELLRCVARILEGAVRTTDMVSSDSTINGDDNVVGRMGGDEFLIMLNRVEKGEDAAVVAGRLLQFLQEPVQIQQETLYISASIGIAIFPDDAIDAHNLIRNADIAMYQAKAHRKNNFQYFAAGMNVSASEQLRIQTRLRRALDNDGLQLHLQPVFESATGALLRAEALVRWKDLEMGFVPPSVFIPIAESNGDIVRITAWLVDTICCRLKQWVGRLPEDFQVSFNVSTVDIRHGELLNVIRGAMTTHDIPASRLVMEMTETGLMTGGERPVQTLEAVRALGISVALDDFGTGYSSLSYLRRFPINELKIDRSFVTHLADQSEDLSIVRAILSLSQSLNLSVTAEGVENQDQFNILRELGCHKVQGFLFSPAIPADRFIQELGRNPRAHRWADYWINNGMPHQPSVAQP